MWCGKGRSWEGRVSTEARGCSWVTAVGEGCPSPGTIVVQRAEGARQENLGCGTKTGPGCGQRLPVWGSLGLCGTGYSSFHLGTRASTLSKKGNCLCFKACL